VTEPGDEPAVPEIFGAHHLDDALLGEPDDEALERARSFCTMLPETREINGFGNPTFRVATKGYAIYELLGDRRSICVKLTPERQAELISRPGFTSEPDTGDHGWTIIDLDGRVHWDEIDELIIESYRLVAPPECVAQLDALLGDH
jgi:predicted DNA-binding protein (MmcQ/YjbR family)